MSTVYSVTSTKALEAIDTALREAAARQQFGVIATHNLKETMARKGVDYVGECMIYEICNPHQAKKVLEADPSISTALPCRISVYREGDRLRLATIRPSVMLSMFGVAGLEPVAQEVEESILAMMNEAA